MKKTFILLAFALPFIINGQAIINNWAMNLNGKVGTYFAQTGSAMVPAYTFTTMTDSADILRVCYTADSVFVRCNGITNDMGKYLNPGYVYAMNYTYRFPRNPSVPVNKTISPKEGAIGLLLNGVPIYGLGNASSWTGTTNSNMGGLKVWNCEVGKFEGFVLDTAFGAHPQQQGAYHSHTTPFRYYKNMPTNVHSPLLGFAFDGNPVYGPYGYSTPTNASSAVTRMISGYALRNITTRTTLPSGATATQTGPPVNATYPLGTYCEDYAWNAANGGTLDEYNGRFCVTPEYPAGTYAYFVTISAAGAAVFPYYIGLYYYGSPDTKNIPTGPTSSTGISFPSSSLGCRAPIMPLKFNSINGSTKSSSNLVNFKVSDVVNVKQFVVERSENGVEFKTIATIKATLNNIAGQEYIFEDEKPTVKAFYRIKSEDFDGLYSYSSTILLARKSSSNITIYPTLANNEITLRSLGEAFKGDVIIVDLNGKTLQKQTLNLLGGNATTISITNLKSGMYIARLQNETTVETVKFVKQ